MKISVGMLAVNGRPFIEAQLINLYKIAHEIIIAEGGDDFWFNVHGYRQSNDGTIDLIKNFPDPDRKIKLLQKPWKNKNEMAYAYSCNMTGDIIYCVDLDEFIDPKELLSVSINLLKSKYDCAAIPHYVFFGDYNTLLVMDHTDTWVTVPRIFRRKKNFAITHLPPAYISKNSQKKQSGNLMPYSKNSGVFIHHYSWIYSGLVKDKIEYYDHRIPGCIRTNWLEKYFYKFNECREQFIADKLNIRPTEGPRQFLKTFSGTHLPITKEIEKDYEKLLNESVK